MENIVVNAGRPINRKWKGEDYFVVPVTMIVPGVLDGSDGPLLYTQEENTKSVPLWNGMPIIVYHPEQKGNRTTSARTPDIIEKQGIGFVFNTTIDSTTGKLIAEGWINCKDVEKVYPALSDRIKNGEPIEVSTGLYTNNVPAENGSKYNGIEYKHIATNYQPDHLAVLPDQVGACSLNDGCGIYNSSTNNKQKGDIMSLTKEKKASIITKLINNCKSGWTKEDKETLENFNDKKLLWLSQNTKNEEDKEKEENEEDEEKKKKENEEKEEKEKEKYLANMSDEELVEEMNRRIKNKKNKENKEEEEEEEEDKTTTKNQRSLSKMSLEDWFKVAPKEVRETVENAISIAKKEKEIVTNKILDGLKDEEKKLVQNTIKDMNLEQLKSFLLIKGGSKESEMVPSYFRSSSPQNVTNTKKKNTPLIPLTLEDLD